MQFDWLTCLPCVAAKPEDMLDQIPPTNARAEHCLQIMPHVTLWRDIVEGEFCISQDSTQNIVEIMCNAASQCPNRFYLLHLAQLCFEPPPLCDIVNNRQHARFLVQGNQLHGHTCLTDLTGLGAELRAKISHRA